MSKESSRFYTILINELLLNIYAVQNLGYNRHICRMKTKNDLREWRKYLPEVIEQYQNEKQI